MADKNKRQGKCKYDDRKKKTKGGARLITNAALHSNPNISDKNTQSKLKSILSTSRSASTKVGMLAVSGRPVYYTKRTIQPSTRDTKRTIQPSTRQKHVNLSTTLQQEQNLQNELQTELKQLQERFHGLVLERMLVCNNACNKDGVEILSTSCGGQPPTLPPMSVILDYECFEEKDKTNKNIKKDKICCKPPITANCKKLINLIKKLLTDILAEFFKSTSSPVMFDLTIAKVAKACVVSYLIDIINGPVSQSNSSNNATSDLIKFYVKVSVQTITGSPVNTARDFLVHVNVNSLKPLLNVPNINALTSKIVKNELKQIPEIIKEIKGVLDQYNSTLRN
jgi:hypothetical protein